VCHYLITTHCSSFDIGSEFQNEVAMMRCNVETGGRSHTHDGVIGGGSQQVMRQLLVQLLAIVVSVELWIEVAFSTALLAQISKCCHVDEGIGRQEQRDANLIGGQFFTETTIEWRLHAQWQSISMHLLLAHMAATYLRLEKTLFLVGIDCTLWCSEFQRTQASRGNTGLEHEQLATGLFLLAKPTTTGSVLINMQAAQSTTTE
jgi:hypothetical protein